VAFNIRVVLDAKGVVANAAKIDIDATFTLLRGDSPYHDLLFTAVGRRVTSA
jgi:hypothetical protein